MESSTSDSKLLCDYECSYNNKPFDKLFTDIDKYYQY